MNKILMILMIISIVFTPTKIKKEKVVKNKEKIVEKQEKREEQQPVIEQPQEVVEQSISSYETRMTSYYPEESSDCTGSGLCSWDFEVNDKGWFTYQGKLVIATATTYLANQGWYVGDGVHLREYYNEVFLTIDGVDYRAIVLDSCGNCMRTDRVDLYVSSVVYTKDTMIIVKE